MKEKKLKFSGLIMCLVVLLISVVLQFVGGVLGALPSSIMLGIEIAQQGITDMEVINQMSAEATASAIELGVVVAHLLIILTFGLWYGLGIRKKIQTSILGEVFNAKNIGVTLLMAVSICFAVNFGMEVAVYVIPESIVESYVEMMEMAGFGESLLTTIAAVCLAPIGEELVYRGTCMYFAEKFVGGLSKNKAFWIANVIQALGFGVFHMNIIQGTYAFLMGLCLGYLVKRYKSIIPAMIAHCVINACSSFLWTPVYNVMPQSTLVFGICTVACLAVTALAFKLGGNPITEQEA
ncbi:MAG: CPBP family intramembrane metalloprotease [Lachnospiraceae bacterium]|nr:CPBP family intramembrane metalloprotease [Lachnospiraceae bacterium]